MAEETCGFYAGVFLVVTGMIFIVGMGIYSIHNPMEGETINNQVTSSLCFDLKLYIQFQLVASQRNLRMEK